jgi:hypothetical protein
MQAVNGFHTIPAVLALVHPVVIPGARAESSEGSLEGSIVAEMTNMLLVRGNLLVIFLVLGKTNSGWSVNKTLADRLILPVYLLDLLLLKWTAQTL